MDSSLWGIVPFGGIGGRNVKQVPIDIAWYAGDTIEATQEPLSVVIKKLQLQPP